ncbi:MAG: winged helix-turn-helix transcriptional regulator [Proteobacteria bacterium]|nr:winged helix-turn-helix transcriptional regulator [Pseudomonadota bacterium]
MAAFQDTREQTEQRVMVHLLSEIERNPSFTQRGLASELGIALGLMNQYLKSSVTKGWIRASQISPRRITYFLTPEGFKEKSQMVKDYLARSLTFFRDARTQCEEVFSECSQQGWTLIGLLGSGDLADIAMLVAQGTNIKTGIISINENLKKYDAILVTDIIHPQETYDFLKNKINPQKILTLRLLHISKRDVENGKNK